MQAHPRRGGSCIQKLLTVVGVGDVELALVAGVRVNVTDQGSLEVVMNV